MHWCRRNPSQAITIFLVVLAHIILLVYAFWRQPHLLVIQPKGRVVVRTIPLKKPPTSIAMPAQTSPTTSAVQEKPAIAKEQSTAKEPDPAPKTAEKEPQPAAKVETKKPAKTVEKTESKKEKATIKETAKEPAKKKTSTKTESKKTDPKKPSKTAEKKPTEKTSTAKKETTKKEPVAKEKAPDSKSAAKKETDDKASAEAAKQEQQLIDKAKKSLAKLNGTSTGSSKASASTIAAAPGLLEDLQVDAKAVGVENGLTPDQMGYCEEMVSRLRLQLKLPEIGEVKIRLTVDRSGKVLGVKTVSAASAINQAHIEKVVPKLSFPPFGSHFGVDKEKSFLLVLCNDSR